VSGSGWPRSTLRIAARSGICPNNPPHAAFAHPVSVTVQCRSPGRRSCQKRAVPMPKRLGLRVLDHLRVGDRAAREIQKERRSALPPAAPRTTLGSAATSRTRGLPCRRRARAVRAPPGERPPPGRPPTGMRRHRPRRSARARQGDWDPPRPRLHDVNDRIEAIRDLHVIARALGVEVGKPRRTGAPGTGSEGDGHRPTLRDGWAPRCRRQPHVVCGELRSRRRPPRG
jgi:hypothetical protein